MKVNVVGKGLALLSASVGISAACLIDKMAEPVNDENTSDEERFANDVGKVGQIAVVAGPFLALAGALWAYGPEMEFHTAESKRKELQGKAERKAIRDKEAAEKQDAVKNQVKEVINASTRAIEKTVSTVLTNAVAEALKQVNAQDTTDSDSNNDERNLPVKKDEDDVDNYSI